MTYGLKNNVVSKLTAGIGTTATSISVTAGEGQLFINNSVATLESRNADGDVTKREIVLISNVSGNTLTVQRKFAPCVIDDTAQNKTKSATAQSFSAGDTISIYLSSESIQELYEPVNELEALCSCICNCYDTRIQQAKQKMIECYGDISYGIGCDGDCILEGEVYLDASKEYEFKNLTICEGSCVRFLGSGLPKIHVCCSFINNGTIDLRGGEFVGVHSFTNNYGTVSNKANQTDYNALCIGCGGKGGKYEQSAGSLYGGNGGNANVSGGDGKGGTKGHANGQPYGDDGGNGGLGCGGGGGGASCVLCSMDTCRFSGADGNGCNGGKGGSIHNGSPAYMRCAIGGGGGGGAFRSGTGGDGGCVCEIVSCNVAGGVHSGDGGNGGIRGTGGNGGTLFLRSSRNCRLANTDNCALNYGGNGGNGFVGGDGGTATARTYGNCTYGGNGGNGVLQGGNGGAGQREYRCSGTDGVFGGAGGNAINNMYGFVLRARNLCNNGTICGKGGNGGNGGCVSECCACSSAHPSFVGGNGGNGGAGANIMIFYTTNLASGTVVCAGGSGGLGGTAGPSWGTAGTNGTNGTTGSFKFCQRQK